MTSSNLSIGVYGAGGFIGKALVTKLLKTNHAVRSVARRNLNEAFFGSSPSANFSHFTADLNDTVKIEQSLEGVDVAVQLMSSAKPSTGSGALQRELISELPPQIAFMEACQKAGVNKVVFLSSGGTVYGVPETLPIPESHPRRPINSYGIIKATIENYLLMFRHTQNLNSVIVRLANPFGPGQSFNKGQGLIPAILTRHLKGEKIHVFGDGTAQRDYLYIEDTIDALLRVIESNQVNNTTLNIGSGIGRSILDVIEAIGNALNTNIEYEFVAGRSSDVDKNILNIELASEALGWVPQVPFQDAVTRTVKAFDEN